MTTPADDPANPFPACVPELTDGVVRLRAHHDADLPRIVAQSQDAASLVFTTIPRPYDESHAQKWLSTIRAGWIAEPPTTWHWAIAAADDPDATYLGTIDLRPTGRESAETGFALHPDGRGRGFMARALRLLQGYVADHPELGIEVIRWRAVVGNWASRRVAWSCGFTHEGSQRGLLMQASVDGAIVRDADGWAASWRVGEPTTPRHPWYVAPELRWPGHGAAPVLRAWADEDGAALDEVTDEVADRYLPELVPTRTTYEAFLLDRREREASGTGVAWAITDGRSGAVLGGIHLFAIDHGRRAGNGTIGVFVLPAARHQGLFYALRLVLDHAFAPVDAGGLGLARVRADADVANTASVRTMLRLGMTYVGMTREERPDTRPGFAGERVDMCQFEVLAGDDRDVVGEFNRRGWTPPKAVWCEDVQLREFAESDAPAVARFMRHPDFGPEHRPEASEADARRWIIRGLAGNYRRFTLRWAICPEQPVAGFAPGEPVGYIRAFALDGRHYSGDAEIGYTLHPHARGRGLGKAAARTLVGYLLTPAERGGYGLRRVTAITTPENLASQKVLAAAGLTRWWVDPRVVEAASSGATGPALQVEDLSPDRWRYGRHRDDPDPPAGRLHWWTPQRSGFPRAGGAPVEPVEDAWLL